MLSRKRYLLAAAVVLVAALTACTTRSAESPGATEPAGPVPAGLERFYTQQLDWEGCAPYATSASAEQAFAAEGIECARLTVPLDYDEPEGTTITIGVLRQRAADPGQRIGSLVLNPGGPGSSGMEAAAQLAPQVSSGPLGRRFDLVGFDPRGVGASTPQIRCLTDAERDADRADVSELDGTPQGEAEAEAEAKEFARKCVERTEHGKKMLANLGTRDVVRDMDVLRGVLGDEKLTYLGYSYGTRIGYTYAETFPGNVRALLLDGALDPEQDVVESLIAQTEGFADTFDQFIAWCVPRQDCALGSDPAKAVKTYQDLTRPLLEQPVALPDGRVLSYDDATTGTVQALYTQRLWEPLNKGLNELAAGQGTTLMALADMYNERDADGEYSTIQDALVAIRCVDDPPVTDREKIERAQRAALDAAEFLDPGLPPSAARDACAFWPVPHTSEPHLPDVEGVPPPLVISSTHDPATPYQAGVRLAKAMDGRLLTFEAAQHTAFLTAGNACVDDAGTAYLVDGTLPPEGTRCTAS